MEKKAEILQESLLAYPYFLPENIPNSTSVCRQSAFLGTAFQTQGPRIYCLAYDEVLHRLLLL